MIVNYKTNTIQVKLVYYGPAMSGKTTTLRHLFKKLNKEGELTSIETTTGRTLFFDFGTLAFKGSDWNIKILLYSATGQDFYASTRPATLQGADGIIFVVDSNPELLDENLQSWNELKRFFQDFYDLPMVVCLNKQDLEEKISEEIIREKLELEMFQKMHLFKTIATEGEGVIPSFKKMLNYIFPGIDVGV